jgi:hypothetical protein
MIMIVNDPTGIFEVRADRTETLDATTLGGYKAHEEMLVRDFTLIEDKTFTSEQDAANYIRSRLNELFA